MTLNITPIGTPKAFLERAFMQFEDECLLWPFSRDGQGYAKLWYHGRLELAHRVICERFNGKPPSPRHETAHSCGNGTKGCINGHHLRWATPQENTNDKFSHGTVRQGEKHWRTRLTEDDIKSIRSLAGTKGQREIGRWFGISQPQVSDIINRRYWRHV